jgi:hypothetical protein
MAAKRELETRTNKNKTKKRRRRRGLRQQEKRNLKQKYQFFIAIFCLFVFHHFSLKTFTIIYSTSSKRNNLLCLPFNY